MRLRRILYEFQPVLVAYPLDYVEFSHSSVQIYGNNRFRRVRYGRFYFGSIDIESPYVRFDENGFRSHVRNGERGCNIRVGRHDHLVSAPYPERF